MRNNLVDIIENISHCLAIEKDYNLPKVCEKYNLDIGLEEEALKNKAKYVKTRLYGKDDEDF